jgi:hypothetical protein
VSPAKHLEQEDDARLSKRSLQIQELSVVYEGHEENILVRWPDISPHGMFINTPHHFPEGAVLQLRFRLPRSDFEVNARCEVRYYLPGVGVGVEFVQIPPETMDAIEREIGVPKRSRIRRYVNHRRSRGRR